MTTDRNAPLATLPAEVEAASGALVEMAPGHWVRQAQITELRTLSWRRREACKAAKQSCNIAEDGYS